MSKKKTAVGLALLLALSLTGCARKKADDSPPPPTPVADTDPRAPGAYQVTAIKADAAPRPLKDWAAAEQGKTEPAYKVHVQDGVTYIGVTAGQKSSGGWTNTVQRTAVTQAAGKDVLSLDVVWAPPTGVATMALTNPVAYFRTEPAVVGEVKVQIVVPPTSQGQPQKTLKPLTFAVEQGDGMGDYLVFHATGDLKEPKVEIGLNGKALASTDLKLQDNGEWRYSLIRPKERSDQIEIRLFSGGEVVSVVPMRYNTLPGERWSNNFYVDAPRLLRNELILKGQARAFEAVFIVEVRFGDQVIARKPLKAKAGAPAYGDFEERLVMDKEIPPGAEVWFLNESMKDEHDQVELIAPITPIN